MRVVSTAVFAARAFSSPPPARRKPRGGEGSGVGGAPADSVPISKREFAELPPPPTPPHRFAGGGEKNALAPRRQSERARRPHSTPPASAKIPPASCRRRSARSTARSGRRGLLPATQADARAATSRARRTSGGSGPAAIRPAREVQSSGCGAAPARAKPPGELRRGAVTGQSLRASRRSRTADPCCGCLLLPSSRAAQAAWQGGEPHAPAAAAYSVTGLSEICHSLPSKIEM